MKGEKEMKKKNWEKRKEEGEMKEKKECGFELLNYNIN